VLNDKYRNEKRRFESSDFMVNKMKRERLQRVRQLYDEADHFTAPNLEEEKKFAELRMRLERL